ncbi:hypothetical protein ABZ154_01930 [Streptomyces sp. NPDC006261]|uniref:hypothetical protein n=1 Tax=Streptomyces sp. NPDC006261 TaxID=3156739 RepID=UPI0033BA9135
MPASKSSEIAELETRSNQQESEKGEQNSGRSQGAGRQGVAIAAAVLLACGGLVGYGVFATDEQSAVPPPPSRPPR